LSTALFLCLSHVNTSAKTGKVVVATMNSAGFNNPSAFLFKS